MSLPIMHLSEAGFVMPAVRRVEAARILHWLRAGWEDLRANPLPSLAYGLLFALGGDLILLAAVGYPHLVMAAISGFFLVAPLLAAGLYELSRARARGEKPLFIDTWRCWRRNGESMALFGLVLTLAALMWERLTALALVLVGNPETEMTSFLHLLPGGGLDGLFFAWLLIGACLAALVYLLAVVSVPLMLDRDIDVATAMMTSLAAVAANPWPLALWAGVIVALTLLGFASALFGLILLMPLLGHASWHAYRELVE